VSQQPHSGLGRLIFEVSGLQTGTHLSVGPLWMRDRPVEETSVWQHTTLTRDSQPASQRRQTHTLDRAVTRTDNPVIGHCKTWRFDSVIMLFKAQIYHMYKDSFRTSQRTQCAFARKANRLMLCKELMVVCCEKHVKHKHCAWTKHRACVCEADCSYSGVNSHSVASPSK